MWHYVSDLGFVLLRECVLWCEATGYFSESGLNLRINMNYNAIMEVMLEA